MFTTTWTCDACDTEVQADHSKKKRNHRKVEGTARPMGSDNFTICVPMGSDPCSQCLVFILALLTESSADKPAADFAGHMDRHETVERHPKTQYVPTTSPNYEEGR